MNGGTCIDGVDNFTCSCPPRLTGPLCECLILDDESYDCEYVSPTPLTSSTQSVLTTLIEEITTPRVSTEMSSTYGPTNDTTLLTTDSEAMPTTVTDTSTEKELVSTATTVVTEITTKEDGISSTSEETTGTSESTTTKAGISELPDHEETRPTLESDNAKTDATTTDDTASTSQSPTSTDFTSSSTDSTKIDIPIATTKETTEEGTSTSSGTTPSTTEEVTVPGEITTTPKVDVSTDQMFTDIPTDRPGTDLSTGSSFTTEAVEVSSGSVSSGSTEIVTTPQSECTDSICNGHGSCINTPHGIRVRNN